MRALAVALGLILAAGACAQADPELTFWLEQAKEAIRTGELEDARSFLGRVLAQDPGHPEALGLQARLGGGAVTPEPGVEVDTGAYVDVTPEEALDMLREEPYREDAPELRKLLGDHYFQQAQEKEGAGRRGSAMVAFRRAIFFKPDDPLIRYEFFQSLMRRERLDEALKEAEVFLGLQSEGALAREMSRQLVDVHTRLGEKQMKANRWDVAIRHFRKVLRKEDPDDRGFGEVEEKLAVCYYTLGVREAANGRKPEACEAFSNLLELRPSTGDGQQRFDRQYMGKLRKSALSPLWNHGKKVKEEGHLLEAHRYFGHVLTLGTQAWMLKLADQYRREIEDLAGPSVKIEERRRKLGLEPDEPLPEAEAEALAPLLEGALAAEAAGTTTDTPTHMPTLEELLYGGAKAPPPVPTPVALAPAAPATETTSAPVEAPPTRWVPGSGTPPPWLRRERPAPSLPATRLPEPPPPRRFGTPGTLGSGSADSGGLGYRPGP